MVKGLKALNEKFTKEEFDKLTKAKNGKSWHDFILEKCLPKRKSSEEDLFNVDIGEKDLW